MYFGYRGNEGSDIEPKAAPQHGGLGAYSSHFGYRNIFWYKKTIVLLILVPHVPVPRDSSLWKTAQADHDQGREKCCFHTLAEGEIDLDKDCLSKTGSMSFWLYQYPPKRYNLDSTGQNTWNPSVISGGAYRFLTVWQVLGNYLNIFSCWNETRCLNEPRRPAAEAVQQPLHEQLSWQWGGWARWAGDLDRDWWSQPLLYLLMGKGPPTVKHMVCSNVSTVNLIFGYGTKKCCRKLSINVPVET